MGTVGFEADRVEASVRFFAPESIWTRHHQTSCARAHACAAGAYDDDGALALHHLRARGSVAVSGQDARAEDGRVDARRCAASRPRRRRRSPGDARQAGGGSVARSRCARARDAASGFAGDHARGRQRGRRGDRGKRGGSARSGWKRREEFEGKPDPASEGEAQCGTKLHVQ